MPTYIGATPYSLGKIKKGDPKPENGIGKDTDHFRFHPIEDWYKSKEAEKAFIAIYTKAPKLIRVLAHGIKPETVISDWFIEYAGSKEAPYIKRMCTGKKVHAYIPPDGHKLIREGDRGFSPPPCQLQENGKCPCKLNVSTSLYIEEFWKQGNTLPVTLETHSHKDLARIKFAMQEAYNLCAERGASLHRAKFILEKQYLFVGTPAFGKNGKTNKYEATPGMRSGKKMWCLTLTPDTDWVEEIKQKPIIHEVHPLMIPDDGPSLLEPANVRYVILKEAVELEKYRKEKGWSAAACVGLMMQICHVNTWSKVPYSHVDFLVKCFDSTEIRDHWEAFVKQQAQEAALNKK